MSCPKCGCDFMVLRGEPKIERWGFDWNRSDTNTIMHFEISVPYKCEECGFVKFYYIHATEEEEEEEG